MSAAWKTSWECDQINSGSLVWLGPSAGNIKENTIIFSVGWRDVRNYTTDDLFPLQKSKIKVSSSRILIQLLNQETEERFKGQQWALQALNSTTLVDQVTLEEQLDSFPQIQLSLTVGFWLAAKHHIPSHSRVKPWRTTRHVRDFQEVPSLRVGDQLKGFFAVVPEYSSSLLGEEDAVPVVVVLGGGEQKLAAGAFHRNQRRLVPVQSGVRQDVADVYKPGVREPDVLQDGCERRENVALVVQGNDGVCVAGVDADGRRDPGEEGGHGESQSAAVWHGYDADAGTSHLQRSNMLTFC